MVCKTNKDYYPQVFLEEWKYEINEIKKKTHHWRYKNYFSYSFSCSDDNNDDNDCEGEYFEKPSE